MQRVITYVLFIFSLALLLLDAFSKNFYINNRLVLNLIVIYFISFAVIKIGSLLKLKSNIFKTSIPFVVAICCFFFNLFFIWNRPWKTDTILYQNRHQASRTIEFQMDDMDNSPRCMRTIDRLKICPFVDWIRKVDEGHIDTLEWKKVNIYVNELGFKGG